MLILILAGGGVLVIRPQLNVTPVPLNIVGSSVFGRYPKISAEKTYNMIISDGWLVPYPGYKKVIELETNAVGRGIFGSTRLNGMITVIDENVYLIDKNLIARRVGSIETSTGDVFIAENNASEIAICDKKDLHIYDYKNGTFGKVTLNFTPGYITFHKGYFIASVRGEIGVIGTKIPKWRLSALNDGNSWPAAAENVGEFETKADNVVAVIGIPGKQNHILVIGSIVSEAWTDTGAALFPYQQNSSYNIDYGCVNPNTIAFNEEFVVWLAKSNKSGAVILFSDGGITQKISTDGITFQLEQITNYDNAYAYMATIDGHPIYHLTFPEENLTLIYDFTLRKFYHLCDRYMNCYIAKRVTYFNNKYYFVSFIDGNLYELGSEYTAYDGEEIPRIRITKTFRLNNSKPYIANNLNFIIEQGEDAEIARVDMSLSRDGGVTFGNIIGLDQNPLGVRKNRWSHYNLGYANEFTVQFRFWGHGRFVAYDGVMEAYR